MSYIDEINGRSDLPTSDYKLGFACAEVDRLRTALAASQDEAEKAKKNEAICHCGSPVSAHGMGDGHSPVEMPQECPYASDLAELRASTQWREGAPDVPEGKQRRYLVSANNGKWVGVLLYSNKYWAPCSDDAEPPEGAEVNDDGDVCWSGWCEESCDRCDTFWSWSGIVDAWMPLPAARADAARKEPPAKAHGCEVGE